MPAVSCVQVGKQCWHADRKDRDAGLTEGLKVASERLSWGFSRGAKALTGSRRASDTLSAKARRALRAAPQVHTYTPRCLCSAVLVLFAMSWPLVL